MFMPKDCREMNMSALECDIYHAIKGGAALDALCGTYNLTPLQMERIITSIQRKRYLTAQAKRLENANGNSNI